MKVKVKFRGYNQIKDRDRNKPKCGLRLGPELGLGWV